MGMAVGTGGGVNSEINVTPLVDVVLVLLIIFMIVSPMLTSGYELDVPQKMEDIDIPEEVTKDQLIVTYTKEGNLYINKDAVALEALGQTLEQILNTRSKKTVFFAAARELNYGQVVTAMDDIRTAGAEAIGLVTDDRLTVAPEHQGQAAAAEPEPAAQ